MTHLLSAPCTVANDETSNGTDNYNQNNVRCDSALSGKIETHGAEKLSKDKLRRKRKSEAFFARLQARRKIPGNCGRCGKPHGDKTNKICRKCRDHHNEYYRKKAAALKQQKDAALEELSRRVGSLENELARMLIDRRAAYRNGYYAGKAWKKKAFSRQRNFDAYPSITKQELATMNHAYENEESR